MQNMTNAFRETMRLLQKGQITPEQARERNAALRATIGDQAYDTAKRSALVAMARGK